MKALDYLIVALTVMAYPMLLAFLYYFQRQLLIQTLVVPAVAFVCVSVFRHLYNAPRPYEVLDFQPVIQREGSGKSMPSRHVFSIFMIAMCFFQVDVSLGFTFCILGVALAIIRVYGGVHYPKDVVIGALVAVLAGVLGFWVFS